MDRRHQRPERDDAEDRGHRHHRGGGKHHGKGPRGGGHRSGGRPLDHGELRLIVLSLLSEDPRHGYELMRGIESLSGGAYSPSPGAIYPTLYWSENTGYAEVAATEGSKKSYRLTEAGQSFLSANEGALKEAVERLGSLREHSQARDRHRQAGEDGLDRNILEVLAVYHERIEREQEERKAARETGKEFSRDNRLLAVGPKTGRFINILARSLESPTILELGTSFGYSAIWLGEAARATGGRLITMELSPEKSEQARQMSEKAGLAEHVDFRVGDAIELINRINADYSSRREHDGRLDARIRTYELAARLQLSATEALDVSREPEHVLRMYGLDRIQKNHPKEINVPEETEYFGRKCLIARRLIERGVRFVQIWSGNDNSFPRRNWDSHEKIEDVMDLESFVHLRTHIWRSLREEKAAQHA